MGSRFQDFNANCEREHKLADLDYEAWALLETMGEARPVGDGPDPFTTAHVSLYKVRSLLDRRAELLR